jgi:hypothetical protein
MFQVVGDPVSEPVSRLAERVDLVIGGLSDGAIIVEMGPRSSVFFCGDSSVAADYDSLFST